MTSSGAPIDIRAATAKDLSDIRACAEVAYAPYVSVIGRKPAPMVANFERQIADRQVWVASSEVALFGFIVFFPKGDTMFLENVAVSPNHVGHGTGRRLITFCEDAAREARLVSVTLYTNEKMVSNLSLYPHLGYREIGRRTEDGFNRVYFEKRL